MADTEKSDSGCRIAEMLRSRSAEFLPTLMDSIPYSLIVRDPAHRVLLANRAALLAYGEEVLDGKCHHVCRGHDAPCDDCPAQEAVRTRRPVTREIWDPLRKDYLLISSFPMLDEQGHFCGIIETVQVVTESRQNTQRIRDLLAKVTAQNKKLLEWRHELDVQLDLAREIQKNLLPQHPLCFQSLCLDFRYLPCGKVGGDIYDVQIIDNDHVGLLIADASGHGVSAAFVVMMIKVLFESPNPHRLQPAQTLGSINNQLVNFIPTGQFVTAFYAVYNLRSHTMRFSRAGHPFPLLLRRATGKLETLDTDGLPLGTLSGVEFGVNEVPFELGDRLLLYTDGVVDLQDEQRRRLHQEGLERYFLRTRDEPVVNVLDRIVSSLWDYTGTRTPDDDVTLMLVEFTHEPYFGLPKPRESQAYQTLERQPRQDG